MEKNFNNRLQLTLLALVTLSLVALAGMNFWQDHNVQQPGDGVWWREAPDGSGLLADKVLPNSPGRRAGIHEGDLLTGIKQPPEAAAQRASSAKHTLLNEAGTPTGEQVGNIDQPDTQLDTLNSQNKFFDRLPSRPIRRVADLEHALSRTGNYIKVDYTITRDGVSTPIEVIPVPADRSLEMGQRVIGLIYLAIGIYVLLRRWTAPRATHFFLFCLVSFALYALKYTGTFDALDWSVFWVNILAESLQPALFLHFALSFPEERFKKRRRWLPLIYAPGALLLGIWLWAFEFWQATGVLKHNLDRLGTAYDAIFYVLAASLFVRSYFLANTPLQRQQLKWLYRGACLAVGPFTLYAVFFLLDLRIPSLFEDLTNLSMVILPLTFSWAIIRYRLMDTDLIFKRGVAYTLATSLILGGYFGVIALITVMVHTSLPDKVREWGVGLSILVVAAIFDPLKRRIQSWVDRVFDRQRYDYRKALIEFGRGLSSETNLEPSAGLHRRATSAHAAGGARGSFPGARIRRLFIWRQLTDSPPRPSWRATATVKALLDLSFLDFDHAPDHSHIFLENAQAALHLPAGAAAHGRRCLT